MGFPPNPSDRQITEVGGSTYIYNVKSKAWIRVDGLYDPALATPQSDGIMSKEDFNKIMGLLLPPPRITLTAQDCKTKFDQGVISLRSLDESLGITPSPNVMNKVAGVPSQPMPWHLHENTYAYDFTVNIDQLLEEVTNRNKLRYLKTKGPQGAKGPRGEPGIDRLDTGPQGPIGDPGANAPFGGILTLDNISFVSADPSANRAVVDITTETVSPDENYLVVSRATIGNPNACPKLVRPKKWISPWLLVADIPPGQCFARDPACETSCTTTLYYVDVTTILHQLQDRYEQLARALKASKEAMVLQWMRTMIEVFNTQKNAICCALENCQSRTRNQEFRDRMDNARIQAAQADLKLIVQGPGKDMIEMDPDKECSLPDVDGADVVRAQCASLVQTISNGWTQSPDGHSPVPLEDIPGMNLPSGGPWTDAPIPYDLAIDLDRGLYRAKIIDCCPISIGGEGAVSDETSNGAWRSTASMKRWRGDLFVHYDVGVVAGYRGAVMVALDDNKAMIIGGMGGLGLPGDPDLETTSSREIPEIYDFQTESWTDAAQVLRPGYYGGYTGGHSAIRLSDGKVLLVAYMGSGGGLGNYCELYDPVANSWSQVGALVTPLRAGADMILLNDGRVLAAGGSVLTGASAYSSVVATSICETYDPATQTWSLTGSMPVARHGHKLVLLNDGRVMAIGGYDPAGSRNVSNTTDIYDPASGTWTMGPPLVHRNGDVGAITLQNGMVLVAGGYEIPDDPFEPYTKSYTSTRTQLYNPSTNSWSAADPLNSSFNTNKMAILPDGTSDGTSPNGNILNGSPYRSAVFDVQTQKWHDYQVQLGATMNHAMTTLINGMVFVVGHNANRQFAKDAALYVPASGAGGQDDGQSPSVYKSRKVQLVYNSGQNYVVLGQIKDYSKEIADLGGADKALDEMSAAWPKFHNIMNSDPSNHSSVLFSHNGGWIGSFINHDQPYTKTGPNNAVVMGPATILIENVGCACQGALVTLDPRIHVTTEFNQNVGVRVDGLQAGEYIIEIIGCCSAYSEGLYSGAYHYTQQMTNGQYKTTDVVIPSGMPYPNEDAFATLAEAEAAYLGLRHSLSHPGGPLWLWIRDTPIEDNFGSTTLLIKDVLCYEEEIGGGSDVTGAAPLLPNSCEMPATQVEWYERGWRIEECCGAYVVVDGVRWLVVKRSLGVDMTCGGGETMNTVCVSKFIEAGAGHPAIAWPTLDGVEFEGRPDSGMATFYYDKTLSDKIMQKILSDQSIKTIGDPKSIELILTPTI